jgi:signal transduction histidine kinase
MVDQFQLAINILLTIYALVAAIIFSIAWRRRKDLIFWFIGLIFFTVGHSILIFMQFDVLFEYIGNGIQLAALLVVMVSNFSEYINIMIKKPTDKTIAKKEKIILGLTLSISSIIGVITIIVLQTLLLLDIIVILSIFMIIILVPLSIFNIRIYTKEKTITRLFMFFVFVSGTVTAFAVVFAQYFDWGRAMNIAMDFIFITFLVTAGVASPIEQRITTSEDKFRRLSEHLEELVTERTNELAMTNQELEAFSYSVSHDLRAPLRSIEGFTDVLLKELSNDLNEKHFELFNRILKNTDRMNALINDLLALSQISKTEIKIKDVNLSLMAQEILNDLITLYPDSNIEYTIQDDLEFNCDPNLIRIILENLLSNAVKFSSKQLVSKIEFGKLDDKSKTIFYVKDNGVGFDMDYYDKLFGIFQRLHNSDDFDGTGIGLVTIKRILDRHKGRIWAESEVNKGATFYFTCDN